MKAINLFFLLLLVSSTVILSSCNEGDDEDIDQSSTTSFDIFTVQTDGTTVSMEGEIKSRTLQDFNNMLEANPDINLINMVEVPGSDDDEINFQVGNKLRQNGINTHALDNAEIASGGVDFFLAGVTRTRGDNIRLGVHAWSDSDGNQATDFPMDSEEHTPNINYYEDLGYSSQWSRDFYFFTINAAEAAGIHYMTEEEIDQFDIFN